MPRHEWFQRFSSSNSTSVLLPVLSLNFHHLQSPSSRYPRCRHAADDGRCIPLTSTCSCEGDGDKVARQRSHGESMSFIANIPGIRRIFSAQDVAIDSISLPFNSHISHISHIPQLRKHQQFRRTRLLSPHKETPTRSSSEERLS